MTAAVRLDYVKPIEAAGVAAGRLAYALSGLLARYAAARYAVSVADVFAADARVDGEASRALDAAIYVMRIGLEFSCEDTASLFHVNRFRVTRAVKRVEARRDGDAGLDGWLADLEAATRGAMS